MSVEMRPYSPYASEAPDEGEALAKQGSTRVAPASYDRFVKEVQGIHTGSPEKFLPVEQEHELAVTIQDGLVADRELAELIEKTGVKAQKERLHVLAARVKAGRQAERVLVESNLRLSSYLARASMNILPPGDREAFSAGDNSKASKRRRSLLNNQGFAWMPKDFTSLKSQHAVLDDRIQVANIALIYAARKFKPATTGSGKNRQLVPFVSFAAPVIKTQLTRYVWGGQPDSHEKPFHVTSATAQEIPRAYWDDWDEFMTPERREELLVTEQVQNLIPLDEVHFTGIATEEVDEEGADLPVLGADEVFPETLISEPSYEAFENIREELIASTLATLSEREAGVIRLRFGLVDGEPRSLDEISQVYGITRERVRQIESKTMSKLRHPMRSGPLHDFLDIEELAPPPIRTGEVIVTQRRAGKAAMQMVNITEDKTTEPITEPVRESWQAYPGEAWDEPVRKTQEAIDLAYADISAELSTMLLKMPLYSFQKSYAQDVQSPYPKSAVERITDTFGEVLEPEHLTHFWNNHLEGFLQHLTEKLGDDASIDRAMQLISKLFAEHMKDDDYVELRIPENRQGQLNYLGAWLEHGTLRIIGETGNYAGYQMNGLGHLQIEGSVQHFAGQQMKGYSRLEIDGNAGDFLGSTMSGNASIVVNGHVQDYCGYNMRSRTNSIEVRGTIGEHASMDAVAGAEVRVVEQS